MGPSQTPTTTPPEIKELDKEITRLCSRANPALLSAPGVGPDTAAALLVAAGDNPKRLTTEASFAALCGASPVQASSGQTIRHRLNPLILVRAPRPRAGLTQSQPGRRAFASICRPVSPAWGRKPPDPGADVT